MKRGLPHILLTGFLFFVINSVAAQTVFINEIHYDNASTDVNEAIEIAGPSGTDLTGWTLVLYNGSSTSGAPYNTINLSGTLPDQQNGFGTSVTTLPTNGLQNGAPDGLALVDAGSTVIQFLSYEGVFTAIGGPADGMTSTDIGVSESSATPIGASLALTGTGTQYSDFTWSVATTNTYGQVNTDQIFGSGFITPVINEFVEILSSADTDLSEYWLLEIEGDGSSAGTVDEVIQLGTTDANGYYTTGFLSNAFENGTLTLLLVHNFTGTLGNDLDTNNDGVLDSTPWDALIDNIGVNDGGASDFNYGSITLAQGFDGSSFTVGGASRIPNGSNTNAVSDWVRNDFDGQGLPGFPAAVADNGEAINTPNAENEVAVVVEPITLVINEIDADTDGVDVMEFIELYDGGVGNSALDGYTLVLYNGSSDTSYNAFDLDGFSTNTNGYFVVGNTAVPGVDLVIPSNGLQNGADAVALYLADATDFPNGTAVTTTGLEDAVVYDTNDSDDAGLLVLLNAGPQLNEDFLGDKNTHSLQRYPNGSGGLRDTSTFVNAIPTPGAANTNATEPITLIINELDADTSGSDVLEFVELFDGGSGNTPLDGFVLVNYNGNGDTSYNAFDLDGFSTNSEGYFVIGNAGVSNVDLVVPGNSFQNGADAVALYSGDAANFPNGTAITLDGLIDAIVYDTNDSDDAGLLVLLNAGQSQLNEDMNGSKDTESLQRIPNGSGGARNTDAYISKSPTPGIANDGVVNPGEIISIADAYLVPEGSTVTITGILTVADEFAGAAFLQDNTAGMAVFDELVHGDGVFMIGDSITVTGTRSAFRTLVQISPVDLVTDNSPATTIIEPRLITLAELGNYPGELVRVENVSFPNPGDLLFGNSNYTLTDSSGNGELRIDNDVASLVGLAQPENCTFIIGVVGMFDGVPQLLPRFEADMPCAEPFVPPGDTIGVSKEDTFDVATWNIEWFGDENNSPPAVNPLSDPIQRDSVANVLMHLDMDVIAVEEIADDALFAELVSLLPGYDYILSDAFSNPDGSPPFQKLGFIYKTATVSPVSTQALLESIHPLYNGGDNSALVGYPSTPDRFFASGRLPFLMTADITINGETEQIDLVALHARANRSTDPQLRYDMRKYDVEVLKDTLDVHFADRNVILLGDYNDDVDETVADVSTTISSFEAYVNDPLDYNVITSVLSDDGRRSFVFNTDMIDHIAITNELYPNYLDGTATVHYEVYDNDYTRTASDHFPVSARFQIKQLTLNGIVTTHVSCNGAGDGMAIVEVSGGIQPYSYAWSNGATTASIMDLSPGDYNVTVTDFLGAEVQADITITEPPVLEVTTSGDTTVYLGYAPAECTTLSVTSISGGTAPYSIAWSTGDTTGNIMVCPESTTEYSVTITDANGCEIRETITVTVIDVRCGKKGDKVEICHNGNTLCIASEDVIFHLAHGDSLGNCGAAHITNVSFVKVAPNPVKNEASVYVNSLTEAQVVFALYDFYGREWGRTYQSLPSGDSIINFQVQHLQSGIYFLKAYVNGEIQETITLVKE